MNIKNIAHIIKGKLLLNKESEIQWLLTDSRTVSFPEESLFFAIQSSKADGHTYINDLYNKKVRNFVINKYDSAYDNLKEANFIIVENTMQALQKLAEHKRNECKIPIIGITGSNGKTIVKEWIYQLLHTEYLITRSPRSFNSQIGVPLSVYLLNKDTELGIFEAGISQKEEMSSLVPIINANIGILTNIGEAHQENFSSLEEKCLEKIRLFKNAEIIIYSKDDKLIDSCIKKEYASKKTLTWGKESTANIQILDIKKEKNKSQITYKYLNQTAKYLLPFTDNAAIENSLHCLSLLLYLNIDSNLIEQKMKKLQTVAMRLEIKKGINNCLLINDTYNSDINSLTIALDVLKQQVAVYKEKKASIILSDLLQTGIDSPHLYEKISNLLKNKGINKIIGIGEEIYQQKKSFHALEAYFFKNTTDFLNSTIAPHFKNEIILIKGSRKYQFEKIVESLESVSHQSILEINLSALIHNFNYFKNLLKPSTKIMCMVKADAYGGGAVEIAQTLQYNRCDYLSVAVADEGVELRNNGIHIPIIVMNPEDHSLNLLIEHNLEPEIYSFQILKKLCIFLEKQGVKNYPIHIKVDTGMNRLGFEPEDIEKLILFLKKQDNVKVKSVFSHLVATDNEAHDEFTLEQINIFEKFSHKLEKKLNIHIIKHILNSAGIERFTQYQFDMVRLGIGHYGVGAKDAQFLKNVSTLKSTILQIKNIKKGETVGYNRNGKTYKDTRIATIPIGYADGYNRKFGNGVGKVLINNHLAPVIGNVCMDLIMVDISNIEAKEGDKIEIFSDSLPVSQIASWIDTIPYEILTSISKRIKRIYYQE